MQRKWHAHAGGTGVGAAEVAAEKTVSTRYILKAMLDFIWPKTGKQVKIRVLIALALLLLSKVTFLPSSFS